MAISPYASWMLSQEARALLTRLNRVKSFALVEPMLPAASLLPTTQDAIERYLVVGRRQLRKSVHGFLRWLRGPAARQSSAAEAQRRFTFLKLRFNAVITQFDLFNDVITQRSEHETGVWLSGLDVVAADALTLPGGVLRSAAGRLLSRSRVRRRDPAGTHAPAGRRREPGRHHPGAARAHGRQRHRVVARARGGSPGGGAARSRHPVAAAAAGTAARRAAGERDAWRLWERWISEIVADFWSVARVGVASTLGLMGVVSLPRAFVFRLNTDDPHPMPWLRVKLSCAMGDALYPSPQWARLADLWDSFYPIQAIDPARQRLLMQLQDSMPGFVGLLVNHRPRTLRGRSLTEVLGVTERQPARLAELFRAWNRSPEAMYRAAPALVFAVLGQARADGRLNPEEEGALLAKLLTHWALRSTLDTSSTCAAAAGRTRTPRAAWVQREESVTIH